MVLDPTESGSYEVVERQLLLDTNDEDQTIMDDAGHFVKYASCIYVKLRNTITHDFLLEKDFEQFKTPLDKVFQGEFKLENIGLNQAYLCYASYENGLVETPYAIILDEEVKKVVVVVRGTRSLEDLVADLQFIPESLEHVGKVCGFRGEGHYCHKGFLVRAKWIYNDIKRQQVLRSLISLDRQCKDYPLVICGHSLGAGVASILSLMLRPNFPSLQCFAYEVCIYMFRSYK
jgi:hypothetical protein